MNKFFTLAVDLNALGLAGLVRRITIELKRATVADSFVIVPDFKRSIEVSTATVNVLLLPNTAGSVYEITLHGGTGVLFGAYFIMPQANANLIDLNLLTAYPEADAGSATTFLELLDAPKTYANQKGKVVIVKENESGLEFGEGGSGEDGKSAFDLWVADNSSALAYLKNKSIEDLSQDSGATNPQTFITNNNLTNLYNSWVNNNIDVINNYLIENNLLNEYITYVEDNTSNTFQTFLTNQNLISNYNTWLTTNKITLINQFMTENSAILVYEQYVINNPSTTINQFITNIGVADEFDAWAADRITKLTKELFAEYTKGKDAKTAIQTQYEQFWLSVTGSYIEPEEHVDFTDNEKLIAVLTLPSEIFFEQHQLHSFFNSTQEENSLVLGALNGFEIRKVGFYGESGTPFPYDIFLDHLGESSNTEIAPFSMLEDGDRLYVPYPNVLFVAWDSTPHEDTVLSITLCAKKKIERDTDTAVLKMGGRFQIKDSIKGWVKVGGMPAILGVEQFATFSDEILFADDFASQFFYEDFSVVAEGANGIFNTKFPVNIKNTSNVARTLTFVPYKNNVLYQGVFDSNNLPTNVKVVNGNLVVTLAANQDT